MLWWPQTIALFLLLLHNCYFTIVCSKPFCKPPAYKQQYWNLLLIMYSLRPLWFPYIDGLYPRIVSQIKLFLFLSSFWLEYLTQQQKLIRNKSGTPSIQEAPGSTLVPDRLRVVMSASDISAWVVEAGEGQPRLPGEFEDSQGCMRSWLKTKTQQANTTPPDTQTKASKQRKKKNKSGERDVEERRREWWPFKEQSQMAVVGICLFVFLADQTPEVITQKLYHLNHCLANHLSVLLASSYI